MNSGFTFSPPTAETGCWKNEGGVMAASSFQNEVPKARINIKLDLHTGGLKKRSSYRSS